MQHTALFGCGDHALLLQQWQHVWQRHAQGKLVGAKARCLVRRGTTADGHCSGYSLFTIPPQERGVASPSLTRWLVVHRMWLTLEQCMLP